jgi:hypothetical protein
MQTRKQILKMQKAQARKRRVKKEHNIAMDKNRHGKTVEVKRARRG